MKSKYPRYFIDITNNNPHLLYWRICKMYGNVSSITRSGKTSQVLIQNAVVTVM